MKVLYITSDQVENKTALPGLSEADLCGPIAAAAVTETALLGHQGSVFNPKKSYNVKPALVGNPDVIILIHVNATGDTKAQGVMGVECGHVARDTPWARSVVESVAATLGWKVWGVSTDEALRGFCYYFFADMRDTGYQGKRLVIELGNMANKEQATYLRDHPDTVGVAIAEAVCGGHVSEGDELMAGINVDNPSGASAQAAYQRLVAKGFIQPGHPLDTAAGSALLYILLDRLVARVEKLEAGKG